MPFSFKQEMGSDLSFVEPVPTTLEVGGWEAVETVAALFWQSLWKLVRICLIKHVGGEDRSDWAGFNKEG